MSDDWVKKYVGNYKREQEEKRQKEEDERKKLSYAEARGPEKFQRIRERITQDVQMLKDAPVFQSLIVGVSTNAECVVMLREDPKVQLKLILTNSRLIQYERSYPLESGILELGSKLKTLKICSDLNAVITVHDDESGDVYSDDSEISEFLLTPLLKHISQ
jgi:hypothetical protein